MALIIGGHPRSGTTILNILCQKHPEIIMTGEFRNFLELDSTFFEYLQSIRKDWYRRGIISHSGRKAPMHARLSSGRFLVLYVLRLALQGVGRVSLQRVEAVLHAMFPAASIVGDKYPRYIYAIERLVQVEGMKRVIIYRDGRDVISSYLRMARTNWKNEQFILENKPTARKTAHAWVRAIRLMEENAPHLHIIRYETFVQQPINELNRLAEYLDVSPDGFRAHRVKSTSIGGFQQGLSTSELNEVIEVAGPTLERLNYTV